MKEIKSGKVKDRLCPTVCGVGVIGDERGKVGGKALKEELKTIEILRKRKDDLSSYNISKRFLEKLGFNTSKLKPATLVGDVIDSSYTLAADDIYFFIERILKTDENEAREGDKQIDAEEAEKEGEDISFNDFMERI